MDLEIQSLVDIYDCPFVIISEDFRVVTVNRAFAEAYGLSSEDAAGRACYSLLHVANRPCPCGPRGGECPFTGVFASGVSMLDEHTFEDAQGRLHNARIHAYPLRGASGRRYLGELVHQDLVRALPPAVEDDPDRRLVGRSRAFVRLIEQLELVAQSDAPVLLQGATGTGKELAAAHIHRHSARREGPLVTLDCTALSPELFESEVFGHERGAFTGSVSAKPGLFEMADGGTLFLDEIGDMPAALQAKLLRLLESGEFRRVGGVDPKRANVRIVAATNRILRGSAEFREDLYYRIAGITVLLPSLADRPEDIPMLVDELVGRIGRASGCTLSVTTEAMQVLQGHDYPGNIRELRNILWVLALNSPDGVISADQARAALPEDPPAGRAGEAEELSSPSTSFAESGPPKSLAELEAMQLSALLKKHRGSRRAVASELGVSVRTIYRKMKAYDLR